MKLATVHSACECQARLSAELDENKHVHRGWATDLGRCKTRIAPAHSIHPASERFQLGWACPMCGRNTLRSFETSGLVWSERADLAQSA